MTDDDIRAFVREVVQEELRKALDEELRMLRVRVGMAPPAYFPPRMEIKRVTPPGSGDLPAWTRQEGGTAH